jgi:hypothetical protein
LEPPEIRAIGLTHHHVRPDLYPRVGYGATAVSGNLQTEPARDVPAPQHLMRGERPRQRWYLGPMPVALRLDRPNYPADLVPGKATDTRQIPFRPRQQARDRNKTRNKPRRGKRYRSLSQIDAAHFPGFHLPCLASGNLDHARGAAQSSRSSI